MSKWGEEELETLHAIKNMNLTGNVLNIAAGDGRFNNHLLKLATSVTAVDIDEDELKALACNCPLDLKHKLKTVVADITKTLPFNDATFDAIFCTGTLHLFDRDQLSEILSEIRRVLKSGGKIVLDFATDITRLDKNGNRVYFEKEGNYTFEEGKNLFEKQLEEFLLDIKVGTFEEINLEEESTAYQSIVGKFLIICGKKK